MYYHHIIVPMYIETVPNRNSPPAILLREGWREGQRVRKRTLANLSAWPAAKIETLRRLLRNEPLVGRDDAFDITRSTPHGHVAAVLGTLRQLRLHRAIAAVPSPERERALALIAARILDPGSKLATARGLAADTARDSLAGELGLGNVGEDDLYAAMDWLLQRQDAIERRLAKRHLEDGALVLYDLTSVYLEGRRCPLAPPRLFPRRQARQAPDRVRPVMQPRRLSGRRGGLRRLDGRSDDRSPRRSTPCAAASAWTGSCWSAIAAC